MTFDDLKDLTIDLVDKYFPKGKCRERGQAIVLYSCVLIEIYSAYKKESQDALNALKGIIEIGKRDMSNPKYDGYFEEAKQVIKTLTERRIDDTKRD